MKWGPRKRGIEVGLGGLGAALALALALAPASIGYANHTLRKEITDVLGPTAWGIYLIVPVPFLVVGGIAWLLYRASRAAPPRPGRRSSAPADAGSSDSECKPK